MSQVESKIKLFKQRFDEAAEVVFNQTESKRHVLLTGETGKQLILGKREFEILYLICNYGLSNKQIAGELNITIQTVKNSFLNICKKINELTGPENQIPGKKDQRTPIIGILVKEGMLNYVPRHESPFDF